MDESTKQPPNPDPSPSSGIPSRRLDAAPGPRLPPDVEQQVRDLLATAAPIGPMPESVETLITRALADEAEARRRRTSPQHPVPPAPPRPGQADRDVLTPLIRQRQRPRPLLAAAAVAAAAALVAVGGSALHLSARSSSPPVAVAGSAPTRSAEATVHIQLSTTAYDAGNFVRRATELIASPATPLREGAAEAPALGPIATEIGLASCLEALQAPATDAISADLATYAGEPAVIIVVTSDGASTAYAVRRNCTTGDAQILHEATPLP